MNIVTGPEILEQIKFEEIKIIRGQANIRATAPAAHCSNLQML